MSATATQKSTEVPEEVVGAVAEARHERMRPEYGEQDQWSRPWASLSETSRTGVINALRQEPTLLQDIADAAPAIRKQERERVREALVTHVGEWALGLLKRGATDEDWTELRRLMQITDPPDTDDPCTCGHVRHEHHTWNENASVGCAFCNCEQFRLDLAALDTREGS